MMQPGMELQAGQPMMQPGMELQGVMGAAWHCFLGCCVTKVDPNAQMSHSLSGVAPAALAVSSDLGSAQPSDPTLVAPGSVGAPAPGQAATDPAMAPAVVPAEPAPTVEAPEAVATPQ